MELIIRNTAGQPIYDHISSQIKAQIIAGGAAAGGGAALHPGSGKGSENFRHHHETSL